MKQLHLGYKIWVSLLLWGLMGGAVIGFPIGIYFFLIWSADAGGGWFFLLMPIPILAAAVGCIIGVVCQLVAATVITPLLVVNRRLIWALPFVSALSMWAVFMTSSKFQFLREKILFAFGRFETSSQQPTAILLGFILGGTAIYFFENDSDTYE